MSRATVLASVLVLTVAMAIQASSPQLVNYQGLLTDGAGDPLDTTVDITFTFYDDPSAGSAIWTETQTSVVVVAGQFNVLLGSVAPLVDTVFNDTTRYLGIKVGGDAELTPRTRIASAPYSFRVSTVDGASGGNIASKVSIGPGHTLTGDSATISGGHNNTASGSRSTIGGGSNNTASGSIATIGGGFGNTADDFVATVSGGSNNTASGFIATIGGGQVNVASGDNATVAGGAGNIASGAATTVAGGAGNIADRTYATVGGGSNNKARGINSVVAGGGGFSVVDSNSASGDHSAIGGGRRNIASGLSAMVPGGYNNSAGGDYSFATGRNAKANHDGTFVWADATNSDFASNNTNQFLIRASGGVGINTNSPDVALDVNGIARVQSNSFPTVGEGMELAYDPINNIGLIQAFDRNTVTWGNLYLGGGNVGIRNINPDVALDVYGVARVQNNSFPTVGEGMELAYDPINNIGLIQSYDRNTVTWGNLYLGNGNVGIGTINPSQKLHVVGNICYTGTNAACSDSRYKEGVTTLSSGLTSILQLRGVSYRWKQDEYPEQDFDDKTHIGFIAQEIEELYPEVVLTDDNGYKSVDYGRLTPVLVEAIKEQQKQIDELKKMVNQLVSATETSVTLSKK